MRTDGYDNSKIREIARIVYNECALPDKENIKYLTLRLDGLPDVIESIVEKSVHTGTTILQKDLSAVEMKFDSRIDAIIKEKDANTSRIESIEKRERAYTTKKDIYQMTGIIIAIIGLIVTFMEVKNNASRIKNNGENVRSGVLEQQERFPGYGQDKKRITQN